MLNNLHYGFIGGGAMAESIIKGLLHAQLTAADMITVYDTNISRNTYLQRLFAINTAANGQVVAAEADVLILAVKPNYIGAVAGSIAEVLRPETIIVSIAAGVPLAFLEDQLPNNPVVRVMPNTPVAVGEGMSAIALGRLADKNHGDIVSNVFQAVGKAAIIQEDAMDAVTGLSGSGPGYAFVLIDALADAGVRAGLGRQMAITLASQTLLGAAKMVIETGEHPAKLRDMVTSPGGTTIAGIHILEQRGVRAALSDAVMAAVDRSREMGRKK